MAGPEGGDDAGEADPPRRRRYREHLATVPEVICVVLVAGIPLVLASAVVGRYTGWFHLRWSDEVARAMIIWLAFLGAGVAVRRGAHFRIAVLETRTTSPRLRAIARHAAHLSMTATGILLMLLGYRLMVRAGATTTIVLKLPVRWIYFAMPVGGFLFVVYSLLGMFGSPLVARRE